jgi:outer membrane protein TolC
MKVSLDDQVRAVEDAVNNHRSYVNTVRRLVAKGDRPEAILKETEQRLPLMEAALETLKWLQGNRAVVVAAYRNIQNGA